MTRLSPLFTAVPSESERDDAADRGHDGCLVALRGEDTSARGDHLMERSGFYLMKGEVRPFGLRFRENDLAGMGGRFCGLVMVFGASGLAFLGFVVVTFGLVVVLLSFGMAVSLAVRVLVLPGFRRGLVAAARHQGCRQNNGYKCFAHCLIS